VKALPLGRGGPRPRLARPAASPRAAAKEGRAPGWPEGGYEQERRRELCPETAPACSPLERTPVAGATCVSARVQRAQERRSVPPIKMAGRPTRPNGSAQASGRDRVVEARRSGPPSARAPAWRERRARRAPASSLRVQPDGARDPIDEAAEAGVPKGETREEGAERNRDRRGPRRRPRGRADGPTASRRRARRRRKRRAGPPPARPGATVTWAWNPRRPPPAASLGALVATWMASI
jgi:hypothetical protein